MSDPTDREPVSVLFVCTGNICRSPTAEGVFRARVEAAGLADRVRIDSAGTTAYHAGEPPDRRSQAAAAERGYDLSDQRARQVRAEDCQDYDYVIAMDGDNVARLRDLCDSADLHRMTDFAGDDAPRDVPDPYYGGEDGFERVLDLIEAASDGLLAEVRARLNA